MRFIECLDEEYWDGMYNERCVNFDWERLLNIMYRNQCFPFCEFPVNYKIFGIRNKWINDAIKYLNGKMFYLFLQILIPTEQKNVKDHTVLNYFLKY